MVWSDLVWPAWLQEVRQITVSFWSGLVWASGGDDRDDMCGLVVGEPEEPDRGEVEYGRNSQDRKAVADDREGELVEHLSTRHAAIGDGDGKARCCG